MQIERVAGFAPRAQALAGDVAQLNGPCIGCKNCQGICHVLLELMQIPELVTKGGRA